MWTATEMRRKRYEAGLCTECGKSPPDDGKKICAECAARESERKRAEWARKKAAQGKPVTDGRGRYENKYIYTAWRGRDIVIRGTSRELAERFGISVNAVCQYARSGERRRRDDVFIEREAIANAKV